jgi:hypothetical protein
MRKMILTLLLLAAMCGLSACGGAETTATETEATTTVTTTTTAATTTTTAATTTTVAATTTTAEETTAEETAPEEPADIKVLPFVYPEVTLRDYTEDDTFEVIELSSDTGDVTPGMAEMNDDIYESIMREIVSHAETLAEYAENSENYMGGMDVLAYSITDENYIQIYNTILNYPTYANAGDLYGFVYDIQNDDYITLDEFMEANGDTADDLAFEITEHYADVWPFSTINAVDLKTFILMQGPDGEYVYGYLFEMEVLPPEAEDPYKGFFAYTPYDGEVWELTSSQLFDPYSVDQYDPPLFGQEGWQEYYNANSANSEGEDEQGGVIPTSDIYGILQGDYYFEGDEAAAHFTFNGTENVDAYYGSGSYETSYTLAALPVINSESVTGDPYALFSFDVFDTEGEYVFAIRLLDYQPERFDLFDTEHNLVGEYINVDY